MRRERVPCAIGLNCGDFGALCLRRAGHVGAHHYVLDTSDVETVNARMRAYRPVYNEQRERKPDPHRVPLEEKPKGGEGA